MLLKYLDGPHTTVCWGNKTKYFLFRPVCEVPDEFGQLILANPGKVGRFEEVRNGQAKVPDLVPVLSAFVCDICQKPAKTKAGLAAHKRIHKDKT